MKTQTLCGSFSLLSVNAFGPGILRIAPWKSRRFGWLMITRSAMRLERLPTPVSIRHCNELFPS